MFRFLSPYAPLTAGVLLVAACSGRRESTEAEPPNPPAIEADMTDQEVERELTERLRDAIGLARSPGVIIDWTANDPHGVAQVCDEADAVALLEEVGGSLGTVTGVQCDRTEHAEGDGNPIRCLTCPAGGDCEGAVLAVFRQNHGMQLLSLTRNYFHSEAAHGLGPRQRSVRNITHAVTENSVGGRCQARDALRRPAEQDFWHAVHREGEALEAERRCGREETTEILLRTADQMGLATVCREQQCSFFATGRAVTVLLDGRGESSNVFAVVEGPPTCDTCGPEVPRDFRAQLVGSCGSTVSL